MTRWESTSVPHPFSRPHLRRGWDSKKSLEFVLRRFRSAQTTGGRLSLVKSAPRIVIEFHQPIAVIEMNCKLAQHARAQKS